MDRTDEFEPTPLAELVFRDNLWFQSHPLNPQTWLHYFAMCPDFYDPKCNNEPLRAQGKPANEIAEEIKGKTGLEYALISCDPSMSVMVIAKQMRASPESATRLAHFYIIHGTIYCAPSIHAVIQSRLRKCIYHTSQGLQQLSKCSTFSLTTGISWADSLHTKPPSQESVRGVPSVNEESLRQAVPQVENMVPKLLVTPKLET
eukprot:c10810_g1_i2.p1 GENE.c10810_g1_i2~~c10810_g1_i2.p1  ORF type:complete len:203 (+),score=28.02 c10810_g1_i2:137-745(+)